MFVPYRQQNIQMKSINVTILIFKSDTKSKKQKKRKERHMKKELALHHELVKVDNIIVNIWG